MGIRRRCLLKKKFTDARRTKTNHNSSPSAFGSVALKISLLMSSQVIKLGSIILSPSESLAIRSGPLHIPSAEGRRMAVEMKKDNKQCL